MAEAEERNAKYASEAAANRDEQERMERESERREDRDQNKRRRANQEAMYAKSGVLLDGTPSSYLTKQAETDELNVQRADQVSKAERTNILYQGALQKAEHLNNANSYRFAAKSTRHAAKGALIGGLMGAGASGMGAMSGGAGNSFSWGATPKSKTATSSSNTDLGWITGS